MSRATELRERLASLPPAFQRRNYLGVACCRCGAAAGSPCDDTVFPLDRGNDQKVVRHHNERRWDWLLARARLAGLSRPDSVPSWYEEGKPRERHWRVPSEAARVETQAVKNAGQKSYRQSDRGKQKRREQNARYRARVRGDYDEWIPTWIWRNGELQRMIFTHGADHEMELAIRVKHGEPCEFCQGNGETVNGRTCQECYGTGFE